MSRGGANAWGAPRRPVFDAVKRCADIAVAAVLLALTAPLQLLIAALVRLDLGKPVLFRQPRPGRGGEVFSFAKFRTMRDPDPTAPPGTDDGRRLTRLGRLLRATSLDELPTLAHVLRGEMSLIGPRPLRVEYLERYTPDQARRHAVRPGITGLAQVSGRNALPWEERFDLDLWYVDHRSPALDLRILARTVAAVLRSDGIDDPGSSDREFLGGSPS